MGDIEYFTCPCVDINFIFECSTQEDKIHIHKQACNILFIIFNLTPVKKLGFLCSHNDSDLFTCEDNMLFPHVKIGRLCESSLGISLDVFI